MHHFGDDIPSWLCGDFGSAKRSKGMLICEGYAIPGDTFKYNAGTGNYLATYTTGYVHDDLLGKGVSTDTPIIQIGKCSKL